MIIVWWGFYSNTMQTAAPMNYSCTVVWHNERSCTNMIVPIHYHLRHPDRAWSLCTPCMDSYSLHLPCSCRLQCIAYYYIWRCKCGFAGMLISDTSPLVTLVPKVLWRWADAEYHGIVCSRGGTSYGAEGANAPPPDFDGTGQDYILPSHF